MSDGGRLVGIEGGSANAAAAVAAAGVRSHLWPSVVAAVAFVAATLFCAWRFAALVDPVLLQSWLTMMALPPLGVLMMAIVQVVRRPDDAECIRIWRPFGQVLSLIANIAMLASPWILLPHADGQLRALMLMFYVWFMASAAIANYDSGRLTWVGLFGVPLSLALWMLQAKIPHALPLAAIILIAGLTLYGLDRLLRRNRERAEQARLSSLHEAAALRDLLAAREAQPHVARHRDPLTPRQIEVARLMAQGLSNKQIAQALAVSPATIKAHVAQVIAVTGARNRSGASERAQTMGLL